MMKQKLFTPSEANAMLPQLTEDLHKLQELAIRFENRYLELQKEKARLGQSASRPGGGSDPFFESEAQLEFMRIEANLLMENFERQGVLLKMINPGLIDFPAVIGGENVLMCWKQGEDSVSHYHGWHDGFIGRKPIPEP